MKPLGVGLLVAAYLLAVLDMLTQRTALYPSDDLPLRERAKLHARRHRLIIAGGIAGVAGTILQLA